MNPLRWLIGHWPHPSRRFDEAVAQALYRGLRHDEAMERDVRGWSAICAPGQRLQATLTLMLHDQAASSITEHPYMPADGSVLLVSYPSIPFGIMERQSPDGSPYHEEVPWEAVMEWRRQQGLT